MRSLALSRLARPIACGVVLWSGIACAQGKVNKLPRIANASSKARTELAGPVQLKPRPDIRAGQVSAFPMVLPGPAVTPVVAAKINAALIREEDKVRTAASDCRASLREEQHKPADDAWQRSVEVTMRGPRFLSLVATDSYYCGGPYPNDGLQTTLVYDLTTGSPVNWLKFLPVGTQAQSGINADGSAAGWLAWPAVERLALKQADANCKDTFDSDTLPFQLYPDAASSSLQAVPADLPHVVQVCANAVSLTPEILQKLGATPELIQALKQAQALQP